MARVPKNFANDILDPKYVRTILGTEAKTALLYSGSIESKRKALI